MNKIILALVLLIINSPVFAQDMRTDLQKHFAKFDLVKLDRNEIVQKSKTNELMRIDGFEFSVSPRDLFVGLDDVKTFRGKINGKPDSEIRLSIDDKTVKGYVFDGKTRFYIESAAKFSEKASFKDHIIYQSEDRKDEQSPLNLADDALQAGLTMTDSHTVNAVTANRMTATRVIKIATDADYEWVTRFGGATQANSEILSIINMAEGVYERQLGITFSVTFQHAWTAPDPYRSTSMSYVFSDFAGYWENNFSHVNRDVAHLFSDKYIVSGTANTGPTCRAPQYAYGLTGWLDAPGGRSDSSRTWKVFAHELAHNLGADHVENSGDCTLTIMNTGIYPLTEGRFCQTSINQITNFVNNYGNCLQQTKTNFDFDGDGKDDISVFRPSNGYWYISKSSGGYSFVQWGQSGDVPVPGDYDGDGRTDLAVYRKGTLNNGSVGVADNTWYILRSSDNTFFNKQFGKSSAYEFDIPIPTDYDGDSKTDLAVYNEADVSGSPGYFKILQSSTDSRVDKQWGVTGDKRVPADYDGDGKADVAVFRNSIWYILQSSNGTVRYEYFGLETDSVATGDYDGDGKTDIAVWRPSNGVWYRINSADKSFVAYQFGLSDDKPVPADYDGDGKTDIAVWRPSTGVWYLQQSTKGFRAEQFGLSSDVLVPNQSAR